MPHRRLTEISVRALKRGEGQVTVWDTLLPAFGVRCGVPRLTYICVNTTGSRVKIGLVGQIPLAEARKRARTILGAYLEPHLERTTVALERFLEAHARRTRASSHKDTQRLLRKYLVPALGERPLYHIGPQDLTAITAAIPKPREATKTHQALSAFMTWALQSHLIPHHPLRGMPPPAKLQSRERLLSDQELQRILRACNQDPLHAPGQTGIQRLLGNPPPLLPVQYFHKLLLVIIFTGLRKTEAHSLTWTAITSETITIPKHIAKNGRELLLPNTIHHLLKEIPKTGELLFPQDLRLYDLMKNFQKRAQVSNFTFHDFRRALSSKMVEWECCREIDTVEAILNHVSGSRSPVQRIYDRASRLPRMKDVLEKYRDRLLALTDATA